MTPSHLIYGLPLANVTLPEATQQCSPLVPGSLALEGCNDGSAEHVWLAAPPGTVERRYVLAHALRVLREGGTLTAYAAKDKGGKRLASELEAFGCTVSDTARAHLRIVTTQRPAACVGIDAAIGAGNLRLYPAHGLWTQPGIFSWDRIDIGSALLLRHLPPLRGCGADFGCGLGVLARAALSQPSVTALSLLDIDRRAVDAARRNLVDARAQFHWTDICAMPLPVTHLDFIIMNPPFHDGGVEDRSLGQRFIIAAASALREGGELWMIANRHLPYETMLQTHFTDVTCLTQEDGFKMIRGTK
jgi:16S rRNA (guanine1207-N2)-methyltransferase